MAHVKTVTASGVRVFFAIEDNGELETGLVNTDFTAVLIEPGDAASSTLTVSESIQRSGIYFVDLPSGFLTTHGTGHYVLSVGVHVGGLDAETVFSVEVNQKDIDNLDLDEIVDGFLDRADAVETGVTWRQGLRAISAILGGLVTGGPGTPAFRPIGGAIGSTPRVTITADANGNRSIVILGL